MHQRKKKLMAKKKEKDIVYHRTLFVYRKIGVSVGSMLRGKNARKNFEGEEEKGENQI